MGDRETAQRIFDDIKSDAHADIHEEVHIHDGFVDTIACAIGAGRKEGREAAETDMVGLLAKYGEHLDGCNSVEAWGPEGHPCDCGLAAALGPAGRPRVYDTQEDIDLLLERSVVELDLALESRKALERGGFRTLGDLCRAEVSAVANAFGETSVEELLLRLDGLGLCVGTMPIPVKPDCAVCGHRSKYHGAGSCHQCSCKGQFTLAGEETV